jgi:quinolinate synthase
VVLDYVDEPKAIRALLKAYNELPKKSERDKDKYKKQLVKMSKKRNLVLVPHILEKNDIVQLDE